MGKQLRQAQVSMEFVFLIGLAFMVMLVFISSTRSEFNELVSEEERSLVKDVSVMVQHELIIASNVDDGYSRKFSVPSDLDGINYTIQITDNVLITSTDEYEYVLNVPSVTGNIQKGNNTINKTNNIIYLN